MALVRPSFRLLRLAVPRCIAEKQYSSDAPQKKSSFGSLFGSNHPTESHSKALTSNLSTYELQFDDVKPECMAEYVEKTSAMNSKLNADESFPGKLVGSWTTIFGDQDTAVNLWVYKDGYRGVNQSMRYCLENKELKEFNAQKSMWLRSRSNQLCQEFSYWGEPVVREEPHIYELRTYALKPGTLIEWGNKWGSGIKIRRKDAVGGFFSQVGQLHTVHHIWAYEDMQHRKEERENMWQVPGWDYCVASTVPLVRHMTARILLPTSTSPMQ